MRVQQRSAILGEQTGEPRRLLQKRNPRSAVFLTESDSPGASLYRHGDGRVLLADAADLPANSRQRRKPIDRKAMTAANRMASSENKTARRRSCVKNTFTVIPPALCGARRTLRCAPGEYSWRLLKKKGLKQEASDKVFQCAVHRDTDVSQFFSAAAIVAVLIPGLLRSGAA